MLESIIKDTLVSMNYPIKETGDDFIITSCLNPHHTDKHPSFSVNLKTGRGRCFSCSYSIDSTFWTQGIEDEEFIEEINRRASYKKLENRYEAKKPSKTQVYFPPKSETKLENPWRGLSSTLLEYYEIYICEAGHYQNRVIFPLYDYKGKWVAFNSRALGNEEPKYKYSKGLAVDELIYPPIKQGTKHIVVCEGILDALSLVQMGIPAIFNFGINNTFSPKKIAELLRLGVEKISIAFDKDEAGAIGTLNYINSSDINEYFELIHGILDERLKKFYQSPCKDFNEYLSMKR